MPPILGWAVPVPTNMETSGWDGFAWNQWAQGIGKELTRAFKQRQFQLPTESVTLVYPFDPKPCRYLQEALGVASIINWDEYSRHPGDESTRIVLVGKPHEMASKVSLLPRVSCALCVIG